MSVRFIAKNEDDACYCHEFGRARERMSCANCRRHAQHEHCDECHACLTDAVGLCDECQAVEDAKFGAAK